MTIQPACTSCRNSNRPLRPGPNGGTFCDECMPAVEAGGNGRGQEVEPQPQPDTEPEQPPPPPPAMQPQPHPESEVSQRGHLVQRRAFAVEMEARCLSDADVWRDEIRRIDKELNE